MEKIIIMMSTYNGEKYLREQLDSLLSLEKDNYEIYYSFRDANGEVTRDWEVVRLSFGESYYDNEKVTLRVKHMDGIYSAKNYTVEFWELSGLRNDLNGGVYI